MGHPPIVPVEQKPPRPWWAVSISCLVSLTVHAALLLIVALWVIAVYTTSGELVLEGGLQHETAPLDVMPELNTPLELPAETELAAALEPLSKQTAPVFAATLDSPPPSDTPALMHDAVKNDFAAAANSGELFRTFDDGSVRVVAAEQQRFRTVGSVEAAVKWFAISRPLPTG